MKLEGYVERIRYSNESNGYTVLDITYNHKEESPDNKKSVTRQKEITCTGYFQLISEGEYIEIEGEEVNHPIYGKQMVVHRYEVKQPSDVLSITRYLGSGAIKGLKLILAERIVTAFGEDTFHVIENEPERLADEVRGISLKKAMDISTQITEKKDMRAAMMFLQQYGISVGMTVKIYNYYGLDIYNIIKTNPYQIADDIPGVGFKMADDIAKKTGIEVNSSYRIKSGMLYTLAQASSQGHTYLPKEQLVRSTVSLLELQEVWKETDDTAYNFEFLDGLFSDLIVDGKIIVRNIEDTQVVFLASYYYTEINVARKLHELNSTLIVDEEMVRMKIRAIEKNSDIVLDDMQRKAVIEAQMNGLLVITGGPGTGKTTTINTIIRMFMADGLTISLAAPTGRAAKRMSETTGYEAQTIHRLLELKGISGDDEGDARFERNEEYPLTSDVIIVDEMSMVDVFLVNALLKAIAIGTRLILVGDANQLPSVGPGNVLKDIIASKAFNTVKLDKIFRQDGESDIVVNAHKINKGEHITLDNKSKDFLYINRATSQEIVNATIGLVKTKLPPYVKADEYDIQVLTPMRKGILGVEGLNEALQQYLNPPSPEKAEKSYGGFVFRVGDKVMQIKNNYQMEWEQRTALGVCYEDGMGVFNGDIGIIRKINLSTELMEVEFEDDKFVVYNFNQLDELELAYAITIHKSQGSEYPAVVLPLLMGSSFLLNRNLLYTAVTRAKSCVCIVGSAETFQQMIDNENQQRRYSGLKYAIEDIK